MNLGSRSQVKAFLKKGLVAVNGESVTKPETKVDESTAVILFKGKEYRYRPFVYYMMNKPPGVVSATSDAREKTVLDVLKEQLTAQGRAEGVPFQDIFPAGRLDKDTVGLLLLTNDGALAHRLLSPGKHVEKCYYVETDLPVSESALENLREGVEIGEEKAAAAVRTGRLGEKQCTVVITEGKFHQVKRMFQTQGLTVTYLKRLSMGGLCLDQGLSEGGVRELTKEEVLRLC